MFRVLLLMEQLLYRSFVDECQDPVTVAVHYDSYYPDYVEFQYVYNQSEIVDNYGQGDTGRYSGILARNASHLGFEVYI